MDPIYARAYLYISQAYEQKGMSGEAVEAYLKSKSLGGADAEETARLKRAYEKGGIKGFWKEELAQTLERAKRKYVAPYNIALLYGRLGDVDKGFEWLEKAYRERTPLLVSLKSDHEFDGMRTDPRFASLLKRVGLPQ
jgi:tetratricopeptide (TPR) repeat protein